MGVCPYQMNDPQKFLMRSGLGYCLSIWSLCNSRVHGGEIRTQENIAKSVRKDAYFRMMFKWSGCNSILNKFSILTVVYLISSFHDFCLKVLLVSRFVIGLFAKTRYWVWLAANSVWCCNSVWRLVSLC